MAVTLKQIAEYTGLSQPTVSHILNNRGQFRPATRSKVLQAAETLGYVPNAAARAMRSRQTRQVGVLIANSPAEPYATPQNFYSIIGLNDGLQANSYVLSIIRVTDVMSLGKSDQSRVFRERLLDGVVVLNAADQAVEDRVESLVAQTLWADTSHWQPHSCIRPAEEDAGALAGQALIEGGAERLLWLGPRSAAPSGRTHYSFTDRLAGLEKVAAEANVPLEKLFCDYDLSSASPDQTIRKQVEPYLRPGVGIATYDVHRARVVGHLSMMLSRRPGVDFGLACCEVTADIQWSWPGLTLAGFDRYQLGRTAAEMMIQMLQSPTKQCRSQMFPCQLVPGTSASCGGSRSSTSSTRRRRGGRASAAR